MWEWFSNQVMDFEENVSESLKCLELTFSRNRDFVATTSEAWKKLGMCYWKLQGMWGDSRHIVVSSLTILLPVVTQKVGNVPYDLAKETSKQVLKVLPGFLLLLVMGEQGDHWGENVKGSQALMFFFFLKILNLFQMAGDTKITKCILNKSWIFYDARKTWFREKMENVTKIVC